MKIIDLILFVAMTCSGLFAQHPDYLKYEYRRIEHKFDNYSTPEILDAIIVFNGDTILFQWGPDSNGLGYPFLCSDLKKKANIQVFHPDYETLSLDSVILGRLYMFEKDETYFIQNGQPISLWHGFKYLAIQSNSKLAVHEICRKFDLKIGYSYVDSIQKAYKLDGDFAEMMFGGAGGQLSTIYLLEKPSKIQFRNDELFYGEIRNNNAVNWIGIPSTESPYQYIVNGIEIEFKSNTAQSSIESLITKYNLSIESFTLGSEFHFINGDIYYLSINTLIPDNEMMKNLMKESIVRRAQPKYVHYVTY